MKISITATADVPASAKAHELRDAAVKQHSEGLFSVNDLYAIPEIVSEMEASVGGASRSLDAKVGKQTKTNPVNGTAYGMHGGKSGPITFWVQRRYAA